MRTDEMILDDLNYRVGYGTRSTDNAIIISTKDYFQHLRRSVLTLSYASEDSYYTIEINWNHYTTILGPIRIDKIVLTNGDDNDLYDVSILHSDGVISFREHFGGLPEYIAFTNKEVFDKFFDLGCCRKIKPIQLQSMEFNLKHSVYEIYITREVNPDE